MPRAKHPHFSFFATQNFSRTDRLLRHRRLCTVGVNKEENQYSQDTPAHTASWSPLQPSNNRLTVWHSASLRDPGGSSRLQLCGLTPHVGAQHCCRQLSRNATKTFVFSHQPPFWYGILVFYFAFFCLFLSAVIFLRKANGTDKHTLVMPSTWPWCYCSNRVKRHLVLSAVRGLTDCTECD